MKRARKRNQVEAAIQAGIVDYVRVVAPDLIAYHVPNGGKRSVQTAAKLKRMGVLAGVYDLTLVVPAEPHACHVAWEIKAANGRLSDSQNEMGVRLLAARAPTAIITSIDEARDELRRLASRFGFRMREHNWAPANDTGIAEMGALNIYEHESDARALALSGVNLDDQTKVALFLAERPTTRPRRGSTSAIWRRARELRTDQQFLRDHAALQLLAA